MTLFSFRDLSYTKKAESFTWKMENKQKKAAAGF